MNSGKIAILACGVLKWNIDRLREQLPEDSLIVRILPAQLHNNPARLRKLLQEYIDELSEREDLRGIAIAYGVCGRGTMGLFARRIPLVIPRVHDCIGISLGSHARYAEQFNNKPGTRYHTQGWHQATSTPAKSGEKRETYFNKRNHSLFGTTFDELSDRYGESNADYICRFRDSWKNNYQRAAYIRFPGEEERPSGLAEVEAMADFLDWDFEVIPGDESLLASLLGGNWGDKRLLVIPPGHRSVSAPGADIMTFASGINSEIDNILATYASPGELPEPERQGLGLGVDTGGTFTDAVVYDFTTRRVVASGKYPTSHSDLLGSILGAFDQLPSELLGKIERVGLSTTLATNAFVEKKGRPVAVILMSPFGIDSRDYPFRFIHHIDGGMTMDGIEKIPISEEQVAAVAREALANGCEAVAVSGFGSVVNPQHELQVAEIVVRTTGLHTVCGHELTNRLNFTQRATTAAMNAKLIPMIESLIDALEAALQKRGLQTPRIMLVKGDGSQMLAGAARQTPVETVLSGPAASVVGAARLLPDSNNAIVADMGGTTLDVAVLRNGLPVMSDSGACIGGFNTSVRAMAVQTIGLGGDSEIDLSNWPQVRLGPRRILPLCRAGELNEKLPERYLEELGQVLTCSTASADIVALAPGVDPGQNRFLQQLNDAPQILGALALRLNRAKPEHLDWEIHESEGRILRCGLTLTDILHYEGRFSRFDKRLSEHAVSLWAMLLEIAPQDLIDGIHREFRRLTCDTLLSAALPDEPWNTAESADLRRWFTSQFAEADKDLPLQVALNLGGPLIAVGAPATALFPQLQTSVNAPIQLPEHAHVANAVGAIAGDVMLREIASIRLPDDGAFVCSWRSGSFRAASLEEALQTCENALRERLRHEAETNDIRFVEPAFTLTRSEANTREGTLLLGLTLIGELRG